MTAGTGDEGRGTGGGSLFPVSNPFCYNNLTRNARDLKRKRQRSTRRCCVIFIRKRIGGSALSGGGVSVERTTIVARDSVIQPRWRSTCTWPVTWPVIEYVAPGGSGV